MLPVAQLVFDLSVRRTSVFGVPRTKPSITFIRIDDAMLDHENAVTFYRTSAVEYMIGFRPVLGPGFQLA